jgi:hypothetical protein
VLYSRNSWLWPGGDTHSAADCDPDADSTADCDPDADSTADCDPDADSTADCDPDADSTADCHPDADSCLSPTECDDSLPFRCPGNPSCDRNRVQSL